MYGCLEKIPLHEPRSASLIVSLTTRIFSLNMLDQPRISEESLRFDVSVEDTEFMHVIDSLKNLVHESFDLLL